MRTLGDCLDGELGIGGERDLGEAVEGLTENGRAPVGTGEIQCLKKPVKCFELFDCSSDTS